MYTLLILIADDNPQRDLVTIEKNKPEKIIFLVTQQTRPNIDALTKLAQERNITLNPGMYEILEVTKPIDFSYCIRTFRNELDTKVFNWKRRGAEYTIDVDFSSGPKPMSGALVLIAHRWECNFIYVGRDITEEQIIYNLESVTDFDNPWDELGLQAREDTIIMFNGYDYSAASDNLERARNKLTRSAAKQELNTLKMLVDAYAAWDRFDHDKALNLFNPVLKGIHTFGYLFSNHIRDYLEDTMQGHVTFLKALLDAQRMNRLLVYDLIANAERRASDGRFDDAVARLYRAIEAMGQVQLAEEYGISDTGHIPLNTLPPSLQGKWKMMQDDDGTIHSALQNTYTILYEWKDPLGIRFKDLKMDQPRSVLHSRNQSILAHGFNSIDKKSWNALYKLTMSLGAIHPNQIPQFPQIEWS